MLAKTRTNISHAYCSMWRTFRNDCSWIFCTMFQSAINKQTSTELFSSVHELKMNEAGQFKDKLENLKVRTFSWLLFKFGPLLTYMHVLFLSCVAAAVPNYSRVNQAGRMLSLICVWCFSTKHPAVIICLIWDNQMTHRSQSRQERETQCWNVFK